MVIFEIFFSEKWREILEFKFVLVVIDSLKNRLSFFPSDSIQHSSINGWSCKHLVERVLSRFRNFLTTTNNDINLLLRCHYLVHCVKFSKNIGFDFFVTFFRTIMVWKFLLYFVFSRYQKSAAWWARNNSFQWRQTYLEGFHLIWPSCDTHCLWKYNFEDSPFEPLFWIKLLLKKC